MHTPTRKQWQVVIDNLYKILPLTFESGKGHLNMGEGLVNDRDHPCCTVHCVGGWYAIATLDVDNESVDFRDGANRMALDLGFDGSNKIYYPEKYLLEAWAIRNPLIWGNKYGTYMFYDRRAYDLAGSIAEVINFLEAVKQRSPIKNKQ
jgi:hypothetical protein